MRLIWKQDIYRLSGEFVTSERVVLKDNKVVFEQIDYYIIEGKPIEKGWKKVSISNIKEWIRTTPGGYDVRQVAE